MKRQNFLKSLGGISLLALIPNFSITKHLKTLTGNLKGKIIRNNDGTRLNVIGDIQTHKLVGSDTNNQIVEWVDDVEPGVGIPPHIHTKEDEIFRVIKGEIEIMVDGKTTVLKAGDVAFAPKNIPHSWKVVGTEKAHMITSAFPAGIELMFKELNDLPSGPPDFKVVSEICGKYGLTFMT
ncbi:cupin domain-containing protein [Winogradskyella forsetii]|uniref:cupin domain-containing protein n=1 Tax=Winogradskyella forsetii TaxID=2686077 RepID=UPI0015B7C5EE|nr:cupin domain-containing protein [Winogradskyella forsetii]